MGLHTAEEAIDITDYRDVSKKPAGKNVDDLLNDSKVVDITTGEVYAVLEEEELPFIEPQPEKKFPDQNDLNNALGTALKADRYTLGKLLISIGEANTQDELDALNPVIETLDKNSSDKAKTAFMKRASVLVKETNKIVERDLAAEIEACQSKDALLDLIDGLTDVEDKKYRALIDERLDYLRD